MFVTRSSMSLTGFMTHIVSNEVADSIADPRAWI
jgi:hypothetical protein